MPETRDGGWILDCSTPWRYGEPGAEPPMKPKIVLSFDQGNTPGDPHWLVGRRARPDDARSARGMEMDKRMITKSPSAPIIHDVELPTIQVTIADLLGASAGLPALLQQVARTLRHEEREQSKSEALSYAHLCGALASALESLGKGL